jgi:hypothetical protein
MSMLAEGAARYLPGEEQGTVRPVNPPKRGCCIVLGGFASKLEAIRCGAVCAPKGR